MRHDDAAAVRPAGGRRAAFTGAGVARGVRTAMPLLMGVAPFGLVVGVLSAGKGLSLIETLLMSGLVFAGTSQILALELWASPVPLLAVSVAALVVNLRLVPMGAALAPWFDRLRGWRVWGTLFTMVDHSYALAAAEERAGRRDAGFLFGAGLLTWLGWLVATGAGHLLGAAVRLAPDNPLFFAAAATFVALLVPLWRGPARDLLPWATAAAVALLASALRLPVPLPLVLGAASGALLGAWRAERARIAAEARAARARAGEPRP